MCTRHAAAQFEPPEAARPLGQRTGGLSACERSWAAVAGALHQLFCGKVTVEYQLARKVAARGATFFRSINARAISSPPSLTA